MQGIHRFSAIFAVFALFTSVAPAADGDSETSVIISIADQRLLVVRDGMWVAKYPISTSKFGVGDSMGSYKTPLGKLRVCSKVGDGLPLGSVLNHRSATGEILPVNAKGRDPIVTRILWLEGLEACNERARARGIYIHGTVEEAKIGKPVSYGCIRMKSEDVIEIFDGLPVGTIVNIQQDKLPRLKRWTPPPPTPTIIVSREPVKPAPVAEKKPEKVIAQTNPTEKEAPHFVTASSRSVTIVDSVPEKADPRTQREVSKPVTVASNSSIPTRGPSLVIKSSGWAEDKMIPADAGAAAALKGSILFADLPGSKN